MIRHRTVRLVGGLLVVGALLFTTGCRQRRVDVEPPDAQPPTVCATNRECTERLHAPAICATSNPPACVRLESDDCQVAASTRAFVTDDAAVVVAGFERADDEEGQGQLDAEELAFREVDETTHGLPPVAPGKARRPLVFLRCGVEKADRAYEHVMGLGVQAVVACGTSAATLALARKYTVPRHVLTIATSPSSPEIGELKDDDLVWRVGQPASWDGPALAALVADVEATVRRGPIGAVLRVALVSDKSPPGKAAGDATYAALGQAGAAGARPSRELRRFGEDTTPYETGQRIAAFRPHVVVIAAEGAEPQFVHAIEAAWPPSAAPRPTYVLDARARNVAMSHVVANEPGITTRLRGVAAEDENGAVYQGFVGRYQKTFGRLPLQGFQYYYDAAYAIAYAYAAAAEPRPTGAALARAVSRLLPTRDDASARGRADSGAPRVPRVEVGPPPGGGDLDVGRAFDVLSSGGRVDLEGATNRLDWDPATGDPSPQSLVYYVFCFAGGPPTWRRTPQRWTPGAPSVSGTYDCRAMP